MDSIQSYTQIQEAIMVIKSYKKGFITNFYVAEAQCCTFINKQLLFLVKMQECVFILRKNHEFYHIYYIATSKEVLAQSLKAFTEKYSNDILVSDIIGTMSAVDDIATTYEPFGFEKYIRLYRMSRTKNLDEPQQLDERVEYASMEYAKQIKNLLEQYFDPYSEQIPLIEEIQRWIEIRKILIIVEKEKVIGFVIFEINGITSYLRYWFTHPEHRDKKVGSALLRQFFHECKATKRQLFWVIESNKNAITRYKHYGFEQELLFDQIMIKNKI